MANTAAPFFPMRCVVWSDFEKPITTSLGNHPEWKDRFIEGEDWQLVSDGHSYTEGPAVDMKGDVYFVDSPRGQIWKVNSTGKGATKFAEDLSGISGLMFDRDGVLYCARNKANTLTRIDGKGNRTDLMTGLSCNDLVVLDQGIYFTAPEQQAIYFLPRASMTSASGTPVKAATGPEKPNGLVVSPDKRFVWVVDAMGRYVWSYKIAKTGELQHGQPYSYVHAPQDEMNTGADGTTMTVDGSLLVATKLGVQIFDQPGRAHVITSRPQRRGRLSNLVFGGTDFTVLYATCGDSVYRRKTKMVGFSPWQPPTTPPKPKL